jgi:hypothetical protein
MKNAIRVAAEFAAKKINAQIEEGLAKINGKKPAAEAISSVADAQA